MIRMYDMTDGYTLDAPACDDRTGSEPLAPQAPESPCQEALALRLMTVEEARRLELRPHH
jgi:hypothetical protein